MFGLSTKAVTAIAATLLVIGGTIAGVAMAGEDDYDAIYAPDWKAGYSFAYEVSGEVSYLYEGGGESGGLDATEFGPFPISKEVLNTDYELDGTPVYVSAATLPISNLLSGEFMLTESVDAYPVAERQDDLAPIPVLPDWDCKSTDCPSKGLIFVENNPLTYLDFPLTQGKRWEQTAHIPIPLDDEFDMFEDATKIHMVGEVGGMEVLDLPIGQVEAVRVDFSYTPVGLQEMISYYREQLENQGVEVERLDVQLGLHEIVYYSPEYQAVVSDEWIVRALADVAIKGEVQGYQIDEEVYAEGNFYVKALMSGASLVEKSELDPIQILQKLSDKHTITDVSGQKAVVSSEVYDVDLSLSKDVVNAAEEEEVIFMFSHSGVDEIPASHSRVFELAAADGTVVEKERLTSEEDAVILAIEDPGVYLASLRAYDGQGAIVSQDTARLVANYELQKEAECDSFLVIGTGYCEPEDVPAYPGIQGATIEVYDSSLTFPFTGSELYLELPDGERIYAEYGEPRIQVEDFSGLELGDWELYYYSQDLGLFSEVEYGIYLDYMPNDHAHAGGAGSGEGSGDAQSSVVGGLFGDLDRLLDGISSGQVPATAFESLQ